LPGSHRSDLLGQVFHCLSGAGGVGGGRGDDQAVDAEVLQLLDPIEGLAAGRPHHGGHLDLVTVAAIGPGLGLDQVEQVGQFLVAALRREEAAAVAAGPAGCRLGVAAHRDRHGVARREQRELALSKITYLPG
jgi:hypothetical protein